MASWDIGPVRTMSQVGKLVDRILRVYDERDMPSKPGRDDEVFVKLFVSAYENRAWAGAYIDPLDQKTDGAVEALVTRADGETMAIEHTLIQPFVGDKRDFATFENALLKIEADKTLTVSDHGIIVYVPVGVLNGKKPAARNAIVSGVHAWIAANRLHLPDGIHQYQCPVHDAPDITLTVRCTSYRSRVSKEGSLLVRRQQIESDLNKVIEGALTKKLPKLVNTPADRHVLFLERDQLTLHHEQIFDEIDRQRAQFPLLNKVDEIWIVETVAYKQGGYVDFELYEGDNLIASLSFENGALTGHSKDGMPYPTP